METSRDKVIKSDEDWKRDLPLERYRVLRQAATERAFTGSLLHNEEQGIYACGACGNELFRSTEKYDSGSGWPSFFDPIGLEAVTLHDDDSLGAPRTEVRCARCGSHLGHVFDDGPQPTGQRYCMNSVALDFHKRS